MLLNHEFGSRDRIAEENKQGANVMPDDCMTSYDDGE
jgi:hypothetical protein